VLDQTQLPDAEVWLDGSAPAAMIALIQRLAVRGAPLIGVAAAASLATAAQRGASAAEYAAACAALRASRPTAVNLMWAMDRMKATTDPVAEAQIIFEEDVRLCEGMAQHGAALIQDGEGLLTHCNTGGLATAGIGTALGVIRRAHEQGKRIHVYADETRPLLQGGRLTAWELKKLGIPAPTVWLCRLGTTACLSIPWRPSRPWIWPAPTALPSPSRSAIRPRCAATVPCAGRLQACPPGIPASTSPPWTSSPASCWTAAYSAVGNCDPACWPGCAG